MGLSLQLFVHLSKLLDQHGVEGGSAYARELVDLARKRVPSLLDQRDPGNTHTAVISAVALAEGLEQTNDEQRQLALANALDWVLRKHIPSMAGLGSEEVLSLTWARDALQRHLTAQEAHDEHEGQNLWQPAATVRATNDRGLPKLDPMLVPDIHPRQLNAYVRDHGIDPAIAHADIVSRQETNRSDPVMQVACDPERTCHGDTASPNRAVFEVREVPPLPPRDELIEITGYSTTGRPEVMVPVTMTDWGVRGWLALSVLAPPMALFCCGLFIGRKQPGRAVVMFSGGLLGWAGWVFATG